MIHNVMLPCLRIACLHMFLLCNFVWNHCKLGSAPTVWHCTPISLMPSSLPPVNEPSFCKHFRYHYPTVNHVRILGVVLDPRITLSEHTKAISNCCLYHFRALRHIRGSLDYSVIHIIIAADLVTFGWTMRTPFYTCEVWAYLSPLSYSKYPTMHVLMQVIVLLVLIWLR